MRFAAVVLACALWFALPSAPVRSDEPEHTTEKILAAWKKRCDELKCIDCVVVGEGVIPKGALNDWAKEFSAAPVDPFPPQDRVFAVQFRFAARLGDQKLRLERQEDFPIETADGPPVFLTDYRTCLIDGDQGYRFIPEEHYVPGRPAFRKLEVLNVTSLGRVIPSRHYLFFVAIGRIPMVARSTGLDRIVIPSTEIKLSLNDPVPRKPDGLLVAQFKPLGIDGDLSNEIWVDSNRDYLITRLSFSRNTQPVETTDFAYEFVEDKWLPSQWKYVSWGKSGIERSYTLKVKSIKINEDLPDDLFVPPRTKKSP